MIDVLSDLWQFMRQRKKFWLAQVIVVIENAARRLDADYARRAKRFLLCCT